MEMNVERLLNKYEMMVQRRKSMETKSHITLKVGSQQLRRSIKHGNRNPPCIGSRMGNTFIINCQ